MARKSNNLRSDEIKVALKRDRPSDCGATRLREMKGEELLKVAVFRATMACRDGARDGGLVLRPVASFRGHSSHFGVRSRSRSRYARSLRASFSREMRSS